MFQGDDFTLVVPIVSEDGQAVSLVEGTVSDVHLFLMCDNKQVARYWLQRNPLDGTVYPGYWVARLQGGFVSGLNIVEMAITRLQSATYPAGVYSLVAQVTRATPAESDYDTLGKTTKYLMPAVLQMRQSATSPIAPMMGS